MAFCVRSSAWRWRTLEKLKRKSSSAHPKGRANRCRTERGEDHEHIDIERLFAQRGDGGAHAVLTAEDIRAEVEPVGEPVLRHGPLDDEGGDEKGEADEAGDLLIQVARLRALPERGLRGVTGFQRAYVGPAARAPARTEASLVTDLSKVRQSTRPM